MQFRIRTPPRTSKDATRWGKPTFAKEGTSSGLISPKHASALPTWRTTKTFTADSPLKTTVFNFVQLDLSYLITSVKPPQRTGEIYDNEITSLIDIYFLRISFIPSDLFRYFIYVTYSIDK